MKISLIQPSRNNLKYLKWSYNSIRKNQGSHEVEICVADDASTDGTWDWCQEMMEKDSLFKAMRNEGPLRLGHTILYDKLIDDVATNDIAMIYHADMYLCPNALSAIEKHITPGVIVSLTRIEPPLHPQGPEKVLWDGGVEPEEFKEEQLLSQVSNIMDPQKVTDGVFAPWAFYRKDFQEIGGHDPLYAPQSKEDSDIFNRFQLNGIKFKQVWDGFVYHMTCRGSRRNTLDKAKNIYEDSPEWVAQNLRSTRNFIRKWGHFVMHTPLMKPIVPPKYDVGFIVKNSNLKLVEALEPWCDTIYTDLGDGDREQYFENEQINTIIDLRKRVLPYDNEKNNNILVEIDCNTFSQDDFKNIQRLSQIIEQSGEEGNFSLGNLEIEIVELIELTDELIHVKK